MVYLSAILCFEINVCSATVWCSVLYISIRPHWLIKTVFFSFFGCTLGIWKFQARDLIRATAGTYAWPFTHCTGLGVKPTPPQRQCWTINPLYKQEFLLSIFNSCSLKFCYCIFLMNWPFYYLLWNISLYPFVLKTGQIPCPEIYFVWH